MTLITASLLPLGIFLVIGLACLLLAIGFGWRDYRRACTWSVAEGIVVKMVEQSDIDGHAFRPVVEFVDVHGERVRCGSSWGSDPPSYKVGDRVRVRYDPAASQRSQIVGQSLWLWLGLGGAGLAMVILTAALLAHVLAQ
jgi:hypothetical protein